MKEQGSPSKLAGDIRRVAVGADSAAAAAKHAQSQRRQYWIPPIMQEWAGSLEAALLEAYNYTDASFEASGWWSHPGTQVDAAIERAVLQGA